MPVCSQTVIASFLIWQYKKRRGKGIGTLLLKEAERWARERGAEYMELGVLEANQGAQRLYARCGYLELCVLCGKGSNYKRRL